MKWLREAVSFLIGFKEWSTTGSLWTQEIASDFERIY